jgi:hypothetical protein
VLDPFAVGLQKKATFARAAIAGASAALVVASMAPTVAAPKKGGPGCLYGQVIDGHSGMVRCLSPEEVTPPGPYDTPAPDAGADAGAADAAIDAASRKEAGVDAATALPLRKGEISVAIEGLTFDSGDVPRAPAALERIKKDFTKCGIESLKGEGTIELRFLVRAPGRAEGVDVVQSRGMSSDIVRCVASSLAGRPVGAPTSDPVAVSLTVRFKSAGGQHAQDALQGAKKE